MGDPNDHSLGRTVDAKPIAQINTRGRSPVIICACIPAQTLFHFQIISV